jgi:hypothetical protein
VLSSSIQPPPQKPAASERVGPYSLADACIGIGISVVITEMGQRAQVNGRVLDGTTWILGSIATPPKLAASERVGGLCRYSIAALVSVSVCR